MLKKHLLKSLVDLTGNRYSSLALKNFAKSSFSKSLIRPFSAAYQINTDEMSKSISEYKSLHDFFTRELKQGIRSIDQRKNILISPVDAVIESMGTVNENDYFIVKNQAYTLNQIFGSQKRAQSYSKGYYFILYLSPQDYHRFHYPIDGKVNARYALGEKSYPVNSLGLEYGDAPFATNYRIISELATTFGKIAMIKVGALNVNSIQLTNASEQFKKGEELGYFSFGSTVILFVEQNKTFAPLVQQKEKVKLGISLATWN